MKNDSQLIAEVHADIQWVKGFIKSFPEECDKRYASKGRVERVEWFQKLIIMGVVAWLVTNLLNLIPASRAALELIF